MCQGFNTVGAQYEHIQVNITGKTQFKITCTVPESATGVLYVPVGRGQFFLHLHAVEIGKACLIHTHKLHTQRAGLGTAVKESQEHRDGFLLPTVIFRHGGNTFQVLTFLEDVLVTNPDNRTAVILGHARAVTLPRQDVTVRPDPPVAHKEEHGLVLRVPLHKAVIKGGVIQVAALGGEVIPQGGDGTDDFPLDYLELRLDILARYQKERTTQVGVVAVQAITVRLVV